MDKHGVHDSCSDSSDESGTEHEEF